MPVLITDHAFVREPFKRDACDFKSAVDGRSTLCGAPERQHMFPDQATIPDLHPETFRVSVPPFAPIDVPVIITGEKKDNGKPRWDLLPWSGVAQVVDVVTFGAQKYAPDNWKIVPEGRNRYFAATVRHMFAWWDGERNDKESGLHHLAHAACDLLFLMWFDNQ